MDQRGGLTCLGAATQLHSGEPLSHRAPWDLTTTKLHFTNGQQMLGEVSQVTLFMLVF